MLNLMTKVLGPARAIDIMKAKGPHEALKQLGHEPGVRVVACGGDGTIRWVIGGVIEARLPVMPIMGVLPLGTGNDLSREFGWGMGYEPKEKDIVDIIKNLKRANTRPLDIWQVTLTPWDPVTKKTEPEKKRTEIMFNYFNMGFDSQAALGFHNLRNESPELFKARFMNKAFYGLYALESWVQGTPLLSECIEVTVDGKAIALPEDLKTLVFLNFTCYQGGMDVWGPLKEKDSLLPRMDDGRVEVVGLGGLWHEMKARTEVSHGFRMGQAAKAEVRVTKSVQIAMSHDGEPFSQGPCVIEVSHWGKVDILVHPDLEAKEQKKRLKAEQKRLKAEGAKSKSPSPARAASPRATSPSAVRAASPPTGRTTSPPPARP